MVIAMVDFSAVDKVFMIMMFVTVAHAAHGLICAMETVTASASMDKVHVIIQPMVLTHMVYAMEDYSA
jgi:hypothetical protein